MPIQHFLLAIMVVVLWGVNFIFVSIALTEIPPLLLCAIRFLITSVPAIFFFKLPREDFKMIAIYGLVMFALQFSLLFIGMDAGMSAGMTSLIMQLQVFFSMFFAAILLGQNPRGTEIIGALISFSGIGIVAMHLDKNVTFLGFILILAAAATWGIGNLITKKLKKVNMISLIVWSSFIAFFPMMLISMIFEGLNSAQLAYQNITWLGAFSVFYIVAGSTWIGYVTWNWLVRRHPVNLIVPFTLLVPIVGLLTSALFLGEKLYTWKIVSAVLVIGGLAFNIVGNKLLLRRAKLTAV